MKQDKEQKDEVNANLKEQISEAIYEGTMKVIGTICWMIAIAFIVIIVIVLGIYFYGQYQEHQFEKANCGGQPCPMSVSIKKECNYPYLTCSISDHSKLLGGEMICPEDTNISDDSVPACYITTNYFPILDNHYDICGWQEARAYFEVFKENYPLDSSKLQLVCTSN